MRPGTLTNGRSRQVTAGANHAVTRRGHPVVPARRTKRRTKLAEFWANHTEVWAKHAETSANHPVNWAKRADIRADRAVNRAKRLENWARRAHNRARRAENWANRAGSLARRAVTPTNRAVNRANPAIKRADRAVARAERSEIKADRAVAVAIRAGFSTKRLLPTVHGIVQRSNRLLNFEMAARRPEKRTMPRSKAALQGGRWKATSRTRRSMSAGTIRTIVDEEESLLTAPGTSLKRLGTPLAMGEES